MRLRVIAEGPHVPRGGVKLPDIVPTLKYRPELFGGPFGAVLQQALRGPSAWSVPERELFAAFVSYKNHCMF
jgi:hypothetical protein